MWQTPLIVLTTVLVTFALSILRRNLTSLERKLDYEIHELPLRDPTFERCMSHLLGPPIVGGNRVTSLLNGNEIFPAMLAAIRAAEITITFETYIYWSGDIGREFASALIERARAGVRVHVLLDWVGSAKLNAKSLAELTAAGVEVERYRPLRWYSLSRMNSRTHRKILVVDGRLGFIGGVGIADQWRGDAQSPDHCLIIVNSPCQVHPMVVQIWRTRLAENIVIVANVGYIPGQVNFTVRSALDVNLIEFLREHAPPDPGPNYGNGHDRATGGALKHPQWNHFISRLGFGPEATVEVLA